MNQHNRAVNILTLNAGSNSLKFEIVALEPESGGFGRSLFGGSYDDIGKPQAAFRDHGHAAEALLRRIDQDVDRIAHRVVHGGDCFRAPVRITPEVVRQIEALQD
ncbi:MAG: hypothetical protein ACRD3Y_11390, partial [Bryobacteraceae bacterium]